MSMNLHLEGLDLWQTPTFITYMCMSYNDETSEPDGGQEGVRKRYLIWVESHTDGVWSDPEDLEYIQLKIKEHKEKVLSVKDLEFYVL